MIDNKLAEQTANALIAVSGVYCEELKRLLARIAALESALDNCLEYAQEYAGYYSRYLTRPGQDDYLDRMRADIESARAIERINPPENG